VSRRRRAALLIGLALVLGTLAASDVARREAALTNRLGPLEDVLVTRTAVPAGRPVTPRALALRRIPARFAPPGALGGPGRVTGLAARVRLPAGAFVTTEVLRDPAQSGLAGGLRRGERVAQVIATGDPRLIVAGARVDVLVTSDGAGSAPGRTVLALRAVEVLDAAPAAAAGGGDATPGAKVQASLRTTLAQAVYLAHAQAFAREIRLLARGS
jgi:pilus assembly protein CpaB